MAHTFNTSTREAEAGDLRAQGQSGLESEFHPGQPGLHGEALSLKANGIESRMEGSQWTGTVGLWQGILRAF